MVGLAVPSPLTTTLWLGMHGCGGGVGLRAPPGLCCGSNMTQHRVSDQQALSSGVKRGCAIFGNIVRIFTPVVRVVVASNS